MKNLIFRILLSIFLVINIQYILFSQWQQKAQLTELGNDIPRISMADSNVVWISGNQGTVPKIYRTVNGGLNWVSIPVAFPAPFALVHVPVFLSAIAARDSLTAFVADGGGSFKGGNAKFYKTTNAGQNWILIDSSGGTTGFFNDIQFSKSNPQIGIALCDPENGLGGPFNLYKTTNSGLTWIRTHPPGRPSCYGFYYASFVIDIQFYGFIVVSPLSLKQYPFITNNGGNNWYYGNDSMQVTTSGDIAFNDNKLNGIMVSGFQMPDIKRTTDGGFNWSNISTGVPGGVFSGTRWVSGSNVAFICGTGDTAGDIIRSNDNGANWSIQNTSGVQNIMEIDCVTYGNWLIGYAISASGIVLKSRQEIVPIGIQPISNEVPSEFRLYQNYPNPFNPTTKIQFRIPKSGFVKLAIYDSMGEEIQTLVNEELTAGIYEVVWDASNFSSGTYFYKLMTGDYVEAKKMILVR